MGLEESCGGVLAAVLRPKHGAGPGCNWNCEGGSGEGARAYRDVKFWDAACDRANCERRP